MSPLRVMGEIEFRIASILKPRQLSTSRRLENDKDQLWPGYRALLSNWLHGLRSFLVYAIDPKKNLCVARVKFIRSVIDPSIWHYGYLFTDPEYRRRGIGKLLMGVGLKNVMDLNGRASACYVDRDNLASRIFNEKLGFSKLPLIRLHCKTINVNESARLTVRRIEEQDIRISAIRKKILSAVAQSPRDQPAYGRVFVSGSTSSMGKAEHRASPDRSQQGEIIGLARSGNVYGNLLLDPVTVMNDSVALSAVSLLHKTKSVERVFLFMNEESMRPGNLEAAHTFDYFYYNENLHTNLLDSAVDQ